MAINDPSETGQAFAVICYHVCCNLSTFIYIYISIQKESNEIDIVQPTTDAWKSHLEVHASVLLLPW